MSTENNPSYSLCTSCMGRLDHLQATLPQSLAHEDCEVLLVDYSCPQQAADWAERAFPAEIEAQRLRLFRVTGRTIYHCTHAKNVTHIRARGKILVNADADNFIDRAYLDKCAEWFRDPNVQLVHPAPWDSRTASCGMFGRIAIRRSAYRALGGYDEALIGWGGDDYDLVNRAVAMGFVTRTIAHSYLKVIDHSDALRTQFTASKDKNDSAARNTEVSAAKRKRGEFIANQYQTIGAI